MPKPLLKRLVETLFSVSTNYNHYNTKPQDTENKQSYVHFFLDDYKFESIWNNPEPRIDKLRQYKGVLSPQYSTYYTMPLALQIYNTFRSRWCGAYMQSKDIIVVPTISWGLPQSYWYCFDGIEKGSTVAVSTVGVKKEKDFFLQGYKEMLRRIEPTTIICYSTPFDEMEGNIISVDYAETNNLKEYDDINEKIISTPATFDPINEHYIKKVYGFVTTCGMGGGGGGPTPKLHEGRQGKHMPGHNNYKEGRSIIYGKMSKIQKLLTKGSGKGQKLGQNKERVDFGEVIGQYVDETTGKSYETTRGVIHHSESGSHIVPAKPLNFK